MPTPISPQSKKILDELRGGRGTPVTPQSRKILDEIQGMATPLPQPAPVELPSPEGPPPTTSPHGLPLGAHGHVIDPTTGQEMFAGAPQANAPQPTDTRGIEHAATVAKDYAFKPLTLAIDPLTAWLNSVAEGAMQGERDPNLGPVLGSLAGAGRAAVTTGPKAALGAVVSPPVSPRFLNPSGFDAPGRPGGVDLNVSPGFNRGSREVGNFLLSMFGSDAAAAKMFGGSLAFLGPKGRAVADRLGLLDVNIPLVGKSVKTLEGEARLRNVVKQYYVKGDAVAGQIRREGDQVVKKIEGIYNGYRQRGVDFAKVGPDGRRVNAADELVTHWIEAGTKGATYATRPQVEAEAAKIGLAPSDLRTIASDVSRVYRKMGLWAEQVGYLKKGTVAHYGDQYAARLYHFASHNPADIEAAIEAGRATGTIDPRAEYLAQKVTNSTRGGGYAAAKARKIIDPVTGEALGREYQAGVTLGAALPKQARRAARFQALDQISKNPELFSAAQKPGWVKRTYGNVEGWFHPVADDVIQQAAKVGTEGPNAKLLQAYAGKVKAAWASYNPAVQVGNIKQNIALAEGAAAARGLHWNAIRDLIPDLKAYKNALAKPGSDPFFEGLAQRSRAFTGESGQLGEVGSSLRNAIGIDTTTQRVGKVAQRWANEPLKAFGRVEEVFKYSLYKRLVKGGIAEDEAARITDKALFDHTDVDANVAALNKYGVVPFLSTRIKGLENSLSIFLKNPDILLRHSGYRLGQTALGIAGPEAQARDQTVNPSGKLRIPIPGLKDKYGRQRFVTGQIFSQNPLDTLNPAMGSSIKDLFSGGVLQPVIGALSNFDQFKYDTTGQGEVVKPGELPPLDAILARVKFAVQGTVPTLTPFVGREWERIGKAAGGQTRYGGPAGEPEDLASALLGAMTGTRLVTPETPLEKQQRSTYNIINRNENQRFLGEYLVARRRGEIPAETFPEWYFPKDPKEIALQFKNAAAKVRNYVTGGEDVPGSLASKAKIRHLADWMMALQERYQQVSMTALDADTLLALSGGEE